MSSCVCRLLEDVAEGAGSERRTHVARVVLHREDKHLGVGSLLQNVRRRLDPCPVREHDVHQDDVGLVLAHLEDRVTRVSGLGHGLEVIFGVDEQS